MERRITRGLDYYKPTMSQVEHRFNPDAEVTFALKNRASEQLSQHVSPKELSRRLEELQKGWTPEEVAYLAGLQNQDGIAQFSEDFLEYLVSNDLPPVEVTLDDAGELDVRTTGPWPLVTFWETVVMSELNELYFENKLSKDGTDLEELYREGDRRLDEKIAKLKNRTDIKFSDFGTRRRFSWAWQRHVVGRVATELPDNFVGTSNIALAHELGLKPIGTFAHELPMVYAAQSQLEGHNPLDGHARVFEDWDEVYRGDLTTALTDTFTSEFFFSDFTPEQAQRWNALRHDSGDPFAFGERVIRFYEDLGIDPTTKTIVFSDGLDVDTIIQIADAFGGRVKLMFGWGTTLTNDLGVKANNFVMKAVSVDGMDTVKLSDVKGKHTGPVELVENYQERVVNAVGQRALTLV